MFIILWRGKIVQTDPENKKGNIKELYQELGGEDVVMNF